MTNRTKLRMLSDFHLVTPEDYGAVGDSAADDTAALQAFFDDVITNGLRGHASGAKQYKTTAPIVITTSGGNRSQIDMTGSRIRPVATVTPAVQFGTTAALLQNVQLRGMFIFPHAGHTPEDDAVGFLFKNVANCTFNYIRAENVDRAFLIRPETDDRVGYNSFTDLHGRGRVKNIHYDPQGTGWANENVWFGGRMEVIGEELTQNLHIENVSTVNANRFYGITLEGVGENAVLLGGNENTIVDPRVEGTWSDISIRITGNRNFVRMMRADQSIADDGVGNVTQSRLQKTLIFGSAVAVPHTGTVDETILATVTIPAGAMGANGWVEVRSLFQYDNNSNNKIMRNRFGGIGGPAFHGITRTTSVSSAFIHTIYNRNSESSQVGGPNTLGDGPGSSSGGAATSAVDTSAAVDLVFTGELGDIGDTITLQAYRVEVHYRP